MNKTLFTETLFVGFLTCIIGFIISYISMKINSPDVIFEHWNSLLLTFFITGVIIHLLCEYLGINSYYCSKGNACKKLNE